jgi:hypothetical protein
MTESNGLSHSGISLVCSLFQVVIIFQCFLSFPWISLREFWYNILNTREQIILLQLQFTVYITVRAVPFLQFIHTLHTLTHSLTHSLIS